MDVYLPVLIGGPHHGQKFAVPDDAPMDLRVPLEGSRADLGASFTVEHYRGHRMASYESERVVRFYAHSTLSAPDAACRAWEWVVGAAVLYTDYIEDDVDVTNRRIDAVAHITSR